MIHWWMWLLLWSLVVLGALAAVAGSVIFLIRKGLKVLREFSESAETAYGSQPREEAGRELLTVGTIVGGWIRKPWIMYYENYAETKKGFNEQHRKLRMASKERAGRPQRLGDIVAAEAGRAKRRGSA